MVSLEVVAILLSGISISASLFYYAIVLKNQNETRQAQLYMNIYNQSFANKEWNKAYRKITTTEIPTYEEYQKKYDYFNPNPEDPEFIEAAAWIFSFYEGLGVFVKQGLIDIHSIALTMTGATTGLWEKYEPFVYTDREKYNMPRALSEFEYLYNELKETP